MIGRFPGGDEPPDDGLGGHGPRHRGVSRPRTDAARSSSDRDARRRPGGPADRGLDRLTYPCQGACAVSALPADPGHQNPLSLAGSHAPVSPWRSVPSSTSHKGHVSRSGLRGRKRPLPDVRPCRRASPPGVAAGSYPHVRYSTLLPSISCRSAAHLVARSRGGLSR